MVIYLVQNTEAILRVPGVARSVKAPISIRKVAGTIPTLHSVLGNLK